MRRQVLDLVADDGSGPRPARWSPRGALRSSAGRWEDALPGARAGRDGWCLDGRAAPAAPLPAARAADLEARIGVARAAALAPTGAAPPAARPLPSFRAAARAHKRAVKRRAGRWLDIGADLRIVADDLSDACARARKKARGARRAGADDPALTDRWLTLQAAAVAAAARADKAGRAAGVSVRAQRAAGARLRSQRAAGARAEEGARQVRRWNARAGTAAPPAATVARDPLWVRTADNRRRNPEQAPPARPLSSEERAAYDARRAARSARDRGEPAAHFVAWAGV